LNERDRVRSSTIGFVWEFFSYCFAEKTSAKYGEQSLHTLLKHCWNIALRSIGHEMHLCVLWLRECTNGGYYDVMTSKVGR
jgi:hypothetical protein